MKKLIVVDDEFLVRKGISSLVDWHSHGYELCGDFANGKEVIAALPDIMPDVIITDLFMNPVTGFELISYVKENYPGIKLIALSNYNDFENVKKAMKLGAADYIFKLTLSPEEVLKILDEVTADMIPSNERIKEDDSKILNRTATLKRALADEDACLLNNLSFCIDMSSSYRVCYIRLEGLSVRNDKALKGSLDLIMNAGDVVSLMMGHKYPSLDIIIRDELSLFVLFNDKEDKGFESFFDSLCCHLEQCYGFPFGLYLSSAYIGDEALFKAVTECLEIVDAGFFLSNRHTVTLADLKKLTVFELPDDFSVESFKSLSDSSSVFSFCEKLKDLLLFLFGRRYSHKSFQKYMLRLLRYLYVCFDGFNINIDGIVNEDGLNGFAIINQADTYEEFKREILSLVEEYLRLLEQETKLRKEIKESLNYIDENLDRTLSIAQVAEAVNMSESHFAHEFSAQVGQPFAKYCNSRKMERAKKLLLTTDMRISEISDAIGIPNSNYFSAQFRKYFDLTPLEYRKKLDMKEI